MTAYADCPDERFRIEWRRARRYEQRAGSEGVALFHVGYLPSPEFMRVVYEDCALYWYLTFYAKVAGDL